ncbi:nucleolar protein dao-5-like [Paramacrobiotus metropolitanus]|uniref:nucleolar protein dao-5-like n=1 Tax=Paramacrobiotus metropolitanus TaxID=2943436 RepID=UPI002446037D|nr:nucleolar protein dao-5-like [Paramacrobiotus metropolitanus]
MKELLIGFVLIWFYLVLTVESKPYKQVNVYTNDSYSDTSGRIYGTIIDKKCNCTKVVKQALSQYDAGEDDDAYQQPATYKRRKATPKPAYSANMDEYEEEVYPKKTTPKKAYRKPVKPGCEDEEDSYGEPEAYPKKKATPKPKGYAATPEYTEEEEDYEPAPMRYPKKKVTPKPTYKKTSIYQETTAEEQYEEGDEYEEKPVKKAKPYKVAPKQPAYEEEEEEPNIMRMTNQRVILVCRNQDRNRKQSHVHNINRRKRKNTKKPRRRIRNQSQNIPRARTQHPATTKPENNSIWTCLMP